MRRARLVFYEKDVDRIEEVLDRFLEASQARCALLIDLEGHLVTAKGFTAELDTTSIAALVAGSFASTREVARKLGETEFSVLFHQGANENIHVSLVAERALAVILFDDRTNIGMVRLYAQQIATDLGDILKEVETADHGKNDPDSPRLGRDYTDAAEAQLDDFFGEPDPS
jgi:predicted regulator of Ras-like GTPase activity (Roadblock/LC7/MglB family)